MWSLLLKRNHTFPLMCSQARAQFKQWKRYGTRPTALSNVAALHISSKRIQPRDVWIVQITPSCWGNAGVLNNMHCSMRWQPFFLLFLDTNGAIPVPTIRTAIRTTTPFSRQLTFTPSNDSFPGFFQLSWWWLLQGYTHLHCFSACSSWPTVWIFTEVRTWLTLTNSFWPAATLSMFNLQPHIRRPRCYSSRANGTPVAPTADSTGWSAMPYLLRASVLSANFFAHPSPSCSILTFGRLSFVDHPRAFLSSGDYSTALFWMAPTLFGLREISLTTFTF